MRAVVTAVRAKIVIRIIELLATAAILAAMVQCARLMRPIRILRLPKGLQFGTSSRKLRRIVLCRTTSIFLILASGRRGTLYIGVTNDLVRRVYEHRTDAVPGFTRKYKVHRLVYYEIYDDIIAAIAQEKRMKRWVRAWKIELIEKQNEDWHDLWPTLGAWADERR
jgi:putative endonuclease